MSSAVFMGGRQAGCVGLLTLLAAGWRVEAVVAYDDDVRDLARALGLPATPSVRAPELRPTLAAADLLVCVHGREIVPPDVLELPRFGGVNVHPCLYRYRGARPVERLLADGGTRGSVGVHRMTEQVDEGEVLVETFVDLAGAASPVDAYNTLYPVYALALLEALPRAVA